MARKTALITGCTPGGLGAAISEEFYNRGFHVYATMRDPSKAGSLAMLANSVSDSATAGRLDILTLDVTSRTSFQACSAALRSKGVHALDVLVNNAGAMLMGPLLDVDCEEAGHGLFEVNVWGMLRGAQEFAPMLIEARGAMLNICSIAGAVKMAWQGVYNASKAAETFLSETLRIEMEPLGVRVVTAMVGEVATQIYQSGGDKNAASYQLPARSYYRSVESFIVAQATGALQRSNESAATTAKSLVSDILGGMSGQTWRGGVAGTARMALAWMPARWFEWMLHAPRGVYQLRPPVGEAKERFLS